MSPSRPISAALLSACLAGFAAGCRKEPPPPAPQPPAATAPAQASPADAPAAPRPAETAPARPPSAASAQQELANPSGDGAAWLGPARRPAAATSPASAPASAPASPADHIAAADAALAAGDTAQAARRFRQALVAAPNHPDALRGLALALTASGRHDEAVDAYRRIVTLSPNDSAARHNLGVALCRLERYGEAEAVYRELLENDPGHVQARYNLAAICQAQGRLAEARDAWREVLARAPHLASAHAHLGEVLTDLGDHAGAMGSFAESAKLTGDAASWLNLAAAARAAGSLGRAIAAAKRAAELRADDPATWRLLGDLLYDAHCLSGRPALLAEAAEAWRESLRLDPHQPRLRRRVEQAARVPSSLPSQPAGATIR